MIHSAAAALPIRCPALRVVCNRFQAISRPRAFHRQLMRFKILSLKVSSLDGSEAALTCRAEAIANAVIHGHGNNLTNVFASHACYIDGEFSITIVPHVAQGCRQHFQYRDPPAPPRTA